MTGHKTVWLFAPQHHDAMTPRGACFPALLNQHRQSSLDIFHSAALSATAALRCELHAGDALLIPRSLTQLSSHAGLLYCGWFRRLASNERPGMLFLNHSCWWHEVESVGVGASVTVTYSWPEVGDAVMACARHKHHTRLPLLKTVDVLRAFAQQSVRCPLTALCVCGCVCCPFCPVLRAVPLLSLTLVDGVCTRAKPSAWRAWIPTSPPSSTVSTCVTLVHAVCDSLPLAHGSCSRSRCGGSARG